MVHTGNPTPQVTFLNMEMHKYHLAFTVAAAIKAAQPVKLDSNGAIVPLLSTDENRLLVGYAIKDGAVGEEISVAMKAFGRLTVESGADGLTPGPVKWASYNAATRRNVYVAATTEATAQALAIMGGDEGDEIEIVIFA